MANLNTFKPQSLTLTGNISVDNVIGNGSQLTNITGANIAGNVTSATTAYNGNVSTVSNNQEYRPLLATNTTGNLSFKASAGISWNPSTYALTAGKISLGGGIGAQGVTGIYAYGANTAWQVQSQNGTGTDAVGQEIGRFGSEYTSGATTYWDSYISYHQGSGANSGWLKINAAGNTVANVTSAGISITGTVSATVADATTLNTAASVGYLGEEAHAFALAVFLHLRGLPYAHARPHLGPNARAFVRRALRELERDYAPTLAALQQITAAPDWSSAGFTVPRVCV
jgi:hypothetical protein